MSLTEKMKAEARRLGFQLVGVTTPDPPPHLEVYERWLAAGRHGEMGYLGTERALQRRADPRRILPECRSILVLGVRYPTPETAPWQDSLNLYGRMASYAWGNDYHDVLPRSLRALVAFIEAQVGEPVPNRWYTDTGPILERELAQRAGLGWIGKNTCLINPQGGSYFLLAEILLGVALEPDPPFAPDLCGTCTRCIEACPTDCILPDRTIDANRCISYLTIELKGSIPTELRSRMGEWVFGCDVCQQVCPWNLRFTAPEEPALSPSKVNPAFAPRQGVPQPGLREELHLSRDAFSVKFKGSPVKRTKRRGYLRNVAVALGNLGDESAVPDLALALMNDPEPLVRSHAAWALRRIGGRGAWEALRRSEEREIDKGVLTEIRIALQEFNQDRKIRGKAMIHKGHETEE